MAKNIGLVGDSIGHGYYDHEDLGWFARLGKLILRDYSEAYFFNNLSQSGDNIADAAFRAVGETMSRKFDLLFVSVGINDLRRRKACAYALDFSFGAREMYWHRLLDTLEQTGAQIVVTDLLPVIEKRYTPQASLVRRNTDVEDYNEQICKICEKRQIKFFVRYPRWQRRPLENLYFDATHPNTVGHKMIAEEMYEFLQKEQILTPEKFAYDCE